MVRELLQDDVLGQINFDQYEEEKQYFIRHIDPNADINANFLTDTNLVLPDDMLRKTDQMSMANGLEIRVPYLDHRILEFAFSLPAHYKIDAGHKKKLLRDSAKMVLPEWLFQRPKHGFDVPLSAWLKKNLKDLVQNELLEDEFIREQNIFNQEAIRKLKNQLYSNSFKNIDESVWSIVVFQYWWKKHLA